MNILIISIISLVVNFFLGMRRARYRKMTLMWWIMIHASIPLIIPLRLWLGTPNWTIPLFIALAVAGQVIGSRVATKELTRTPRP